MRTRTRPRPPYSDTIHPLPARLLSGDAFEAKPRDDNQPPPRRSRAWARRQRHASGGWGE